MENEGGSKESKGGSKEGEGSSKEGSSSIKQEKKAKKKVSKSKRVKRAKRRGTYQPKPKESDNLPTVGLADIDLAECVYSDDEERQEFLKVVDALQATTQCTPPENEPSTSGFQTTDNSKSNDVPGFPTQFTSSVNETGSSQISSQSSTSALETTNNSSATGQYTLSENEPSTSGLQTTDNSKSNDVPGFPTQFSSSNQETGDNQDSLQYYPGIELIEMGIAKFKKDLVHPWVPIASRKGFHLFFLSDEPPKAIQREIFMSYEGQESIFVHCKPLPFGESLLESVDSGAVRFDKSTVNDFCERGIKIARKCLQYDICIGANHMETQSFWGQVPNTDIDENSYRESKYSSTCRSRSCSLFIELGKGKRCMPCNLVIRSLRSRGKFLSSETVHPNTPNIYLSHEQALKKMHLQQEEIRKKNALIATLRQRINNILDEEGVSLDKDVSQDLSDILAKCENMSPIQQMFLQEQFDQSNKADARSHRWHPDMIRFALHIKMISSAAYEAIRDAGLIKLPSSRTLFDYSHAFAAQEGVSEGVLNIVTDRVASFKKPHQKFVGLIMDEMHVSKNLVWRVSDGSLVGYVQLEEVEKEIKAFERHISGEEASTKVPLANKILAYMVKGLTSDLRYVVAAYPCNQLTKEMLYCRTWHVISRLEGRGVGVLTITSDGSTVNRAFYDMHEPATRTSSGIVFDTINFCSPDGRVLHFVADVAHLIKTIRNCFFNSGEGEKKTRCLQINGEKIVWKTIVRLYLTYKQCNLRKSYKLNAQNVFPNSYSCMKVRHAAEVLSKTVAADIEQQGWADTKELVRFIRNVDIFFDCLNGAYSLQHVKQKKPDLAPYSTVDDPRFEWLHSFLDYLQEWKQQVDALPLTPKEREKAMLSHQTRNGIEIAIRGIEGATKFLVSKGAYVMARVYSQDFMEQDFSRHRGAGGGSTNPNISQYLQHQVTMSIHRDMGTRRRRGNVEDENKGMTLTNEPLPKRLRRSR